MIVCLNIGIYAIEIKLNYLQQDFNSDRLTLVIITRI